MIQVEMARKKSIIYRAASAADTAWCYIYALVTSYSVLNQHE